MYNSAVTYNFSYKKIFLVGAFLIILSCVNSQSVVGYFSPVRVCTEFRPNYVVLHKLFFPICSSWSRVQWGKNISSLSNSDRGDFYIFQNEIYNYN